MGIRTPDPHNAIVVLYQLSYDPIRTAANVNRALFLSKLKGMADPNTQMSRVKRGTEARRRRACPQRIPRRSHCGLN